MLNSNDKIYNALCNCDVDDLVWKMRAYTINKLGHNKDNYDGLEPSDFVYKIFEKSLAGIRNWDSSKVDFESFMFGSLKSEISAFIEKCKRRKAGQAGNGPDYEDSQIIKIPVILGEEGFKDTSIENIDYEMEKNEFLNHLKNSGATDIEILIFECWCEDIYRPKEISELLEEDITTVYNAVKRLQKRRKKILQKKL